MGHRALVAYERADAYDLHYSHWGALNLALVDEIGPETPFGDPDSGGSTVDPDPIATGVSWRTILETHLDPLEHEALYVVTPGYDVRAYRVLWFGFDHRNGSEGALLSTDRSSRDDHLVTWFLDAKEILAELIDRGVCTERDAREYLADALERRAGDDRDVVIVGDE